tara:strand:+ start:862 stop:999 length:138 start_codon:yes stop_codon:yes gene_type:complete
VYASVHLSRRREKREYGIQGGEEKRKAGEIEGGKERELTRPPDAF